MAASNATHQLLLDNESHTCVPTRLDSLLPGLSDKYTLLILPVVAYWTFSLAFHFCDEHGYLSKYKLHTPAEFRKRNRVSVREVVREVLTQHAMQTLLGGLLAYYEPDEYTGCEARDVATLAQRIQPWLRALCSFGALITEINPLGGNARFIKASPALMGISPSTTATLDETLAKLIYYILIPTFQYALAAFFIDTWQYMIHRTMHTSSYLYRTFHSRHHRLYVPYAFGALYNHPLEGFLEDTVGSLLAFKLARMSVRQGIWLFTVGTLKTVDDHSGFRLPWDPFQWVTENNALYHDIHHQSWGMKTNFSQPFTSIWDRVFGTRWQGSEQETLDRYQNGKASAGKTVGFKLH